MFKFKGLAVILVKHGFVNLYFKVRNHFKIWEIPRTRTPRIEESSITDTEFHSDFLELVESAGNNIEVFVKFRSCSAFINILDHVSIQHGEHYINEILSTGQSELLNRNNLNLLKSIDSVGGGLQYYFKGVGRLSPAYLRYLKVLGDLRILFGDISELSVGEIGAGFGGQGLVLNKIAQVKKITFYDLPPVLELTAQYLKSTGCSGNFNYVDGRNPAEGIFDLVLSNYAFSELARPIQELYLEKVILNSRHGYITWNDLAFQKLQSFSLADLTRLIPNSQISPEVPLTAQNNSIIYW